MSTGTELTVLLLIYTLIRESVYLYQTNQLLNKLMSRNYNEYEYTRSVMKGTMEPQHPKVNQEMELAEDLAPIHSFGVN